MRASVSTERAAEPQVDALLVEELGRAQRGVLPLAADDILRQRGPVVGQVALVVEQNDLALVPRASQLLRGSHTRESGSCYYDPFDCHLVHPPHRGVTSATRVRALFIPNARTGLNSAPIPATPKYPAAQHGGGPARHITLTGRIMMDNARPARSPRPTRHEEHS